MIPSATQLYGFSQASTSPCERETSSAAPLHSGLFLPFSLQILTARRFAPLSSASTNSPICDWGTRVVSAPFSTVTKSSERATNFHPGAHRPEVQTWTSWPFFRPMLFSLSAFGLGEISLDGFGREAPTISELSSSGLQPLGARFLPCVQLTISSPEPFHLAAQE